VYVRLPTLQERDELLAQRLIVISRPAFLFLDEVFLFLREKQLLRRVRNRMPRRFRELTCLQLRHPK
jgi:hypothetical protein